MEILALIESVGAAASQLNHLAVSRATVQQQRIISRRGGVPVKSHRMARKWTQSRRSGGHREGLRKRAAVSLFHACHWNFPPTESVESPRLLLSHALSTILDRFVCARVAGLWCV